MKAIGNVLIGTNAERLGLGTLRPGWRFYVGATGIEWTVNEAGDTWIQTGGPSLTSLADYTQGSLIYGGAVDWGTLAVGSANAFLTTDGTDVAWSTGLLSITAAKTLTVNNSLTLAGTDGKTLTLTDSLTVEGGNTGTLHFDAAATVTVSASCTINDWFDQSVKQAASPTFANCYVADGGHYGIAGNGLLTFNTAGTAVFSGCNVGIGDWRDLGSFTESGLEIADRDVHIYDTGDLGSEQHTHSNAASIASEADATTGWASTGLTLTSDNTEFHSGAFSLKGVAIDGIADRMEYALSGLKIGALYKVSIWVKMSAGADDPNFDNWTWTTIAWTIINSTDWKEYTFYQVATATSGLIRIYSGQTGGGGDVNYVDDVSVKEVIGGDLITRGILTGGGTTGLKISVDGNVGVKATSFGTNAAAVFGIANGTEPTTSPADMIQLFSMDISGGGASLGVRTEETVVEETPTLGHRVKIKWNGAEYWLGLDAV